MCYSIFYQHQISSKEAIIMVGSGSFQVMYIFSVIMMCYDARYLLIGLDDVNGGRSNEMPRFDKGSIIRFNL